MAKSGLCYYRYSRHLLFLQTLVSSSTRKHAFQAPQVSLNQIEKFLEADFFQNCEKFIRFKILTPRAKRKLGENPTPGAVRMGKSPGSPGGRMVRLGID